MNVLIIDHHFSQDIDALKRASKGRHIFKTISSSYFALRFLKYFPDEVLSTNYELFWTEKFSLARQQWKEESCSALIELFRIFPFDLIVSPSDAFVYIRDLVAAAHELGVPFMVLQKETTISPYTMEIESRTIGKYLPFISDYMTVCSQRHKQYWLNAGADGNLIEVTGQPRFDLYVNREQWQGLVHLGIRPKNAKGTILFFTYDLGAYLPIEEYETGRLSWSLLRSETESVLLDIVENYGYNLLVKPHPQQDRADLDRMESRLRKLSGTNWSKSVFLLSPALDARHLIIGADIIVAFQTTALLEALNAGKMVVYTYWGDIVNLVENELIPFHRYPAAIPCARSQDELRNLILNMPAQQILNFREQKELFEEYLGIVDGKATERAFAAMERLVEDQKFRGIQSAHLRKSIQASNFPYYVKEILRASAKLLVYSLLLLLLVPLRFTGHTAVQWYKIIARVRNQFLRIMELRAIPSGILPSHEEIIGQTDAAWLHRVIGYIRKNLPKFS